MCKIDRFALDKAPARSSFDIRQLIKKFHDIKEVNLKVGWNQKNVRYTLDREIQLKVQLSF